MGDKLIQKYEFGRIVIDGKKYTNDVLVHDGDVEGWWRKESHYVDIDNIREAVARGADLIVFGTGYSGYMAVPKHTQDYLAEKSIRFIIEDTKQAIKEFNESDSNKMALLHLTC
jgi:hypothetical protein